MQSMHPNWKQKEGFCSQAWFFLETCKSLQGFGSDVGGKCGGTLLLENHAHVVNEELYVAKGPEKML